MVQMGMDTAGSPADQIINSVNGLVGSLNMLAPNLSAMTSAVLQSIPTLLKAFTDTLPGIVSQLASTIPTIVEALVAALPGLIEALLSELPALIDGVFTALESLVGALPAILTSLMESLPSILVSAISGAAGLVQAIVLAIPDIVSALILGIPDIITALVGMLPELVVAFAKMYVELGKEIIRLIVQDIPLIIAEFKSIIPNLRDLLFEQFAAFMDRLKDPATWRAIFTTLKDGIKAIFQDIAEWFQNLRTMEGRRENRRNRRDRRGEGWFGREQDERGRVLRELFTGWGGLFESYHVGTNFVPRTGLAFLHKGEAVVPASQNPSNPASAAGAKGYKSQPTNVSVTMVAEGQVLDSILVKAGRKGHAPGIFRAMRKGSGVTIGFDRGNFAPQGR